MFPYLATATIKYKSPHKQDLTFSKGETIRVTAVAPTDQTDSDDDDDWLIGESIDGTRKGTFPAEFVQKEDPVIQAANEAVPEALPSTQPVEEIQTEPQAPVVTEAAKEHAREGETQTAGFGAPLPPRPPSDDEDEGEEVQEPPVKEPVSQKPPSTEETKSTPTAPVAEEKPIADNSASVEAAAPAPAKSPPVVAKPAGMSSSFRDRLAAFNKPAESSAPPPLPKAKPGGWKRPAPVPGTSKPVLPGQPTPAPAAARVAPEPSSAGSPPPKPSQSGIGFSAADAQSSIKMSLKERMAALQRGDQPQPSAEKPALSAPGKIGADKRSAALTGIGLAPPAGGLERNSSIENNKTADSVAAPSAKGDEEDQVAASAPVPEIEKNVETTTAPVIEPEAEQDIQDEPATESVEVDEKPALTEEEEEAERRAAIAKRMAALGGRRMGGGPALFGAPAPSPNRTATKSSTASNEPTTEEAPINVEQPAKDTPLSPASEAESKPQTLAVPRRAAPPRKKRSAPSPTAEAEPDVEPKEEGEEQPLSPATDVDPTPASVKEDTQAAAIQEPEEATEEKEELVETLEDEPKSAGGLTVGDENEPGSVVSPGGYESEDARIKEHERQLEEYLKANKIDAAIPAEEAKEADIQEEDDVQEDDDDKPAPLRQDTTSPNSPSRPPSARPPVPRTSLPPPPREEGIASPPIPQSPPPVLPSSHEQQSSIDSVVESNGPILAAPKPRLAMPTEDPEDDELLETAAERELTEEEEAAERKAKLLKRMAALGGQRIGAPPIMGAPMPTRKKSVAQEEEERAPEDEVAMIVNSPLEERVVSPPPVLASPPPLPTSPSPAGVPPLPPGRPSSTAPLGEAASTILRGEIPEGLGRRTSMRPTVPQTPLARSREASTMEEREDDDEEEEKEEEEEERSVPPMSPPSRPPSKAPPPPSVAPPPASIEPNRSSRDLDLMPSSRWWRHGLTPLRLPPTLSGRPDAILYANTSSLTKRGLSTHTADIHMLFEDYSTTTISLSFLDDDTDERNTILSQTHRDAPPQPDEATLKRWSETLGAQIAVKGQEVIRGGQAVGDASQRALIAHILASVPALPPVGTIFGFPVTSPAPGDILQTQNAELRGKKGLAPYHTSHPSTTALILEYDSRKHKIRALIQNTPKKPLEEHSFRLDDLKSGSITIYRAVPRTSVGW